VQEIPIELHTSKLILLFAMLDAASLDQSKVSKVGGMLFVAGAPHHWQNCQRHCAFLAGWVV